MNGKILHSIAVGLCLFALAGRANSVRELGTVTPGAPNDPTSQQGFLTGLINGYNAGTRGSWTVAGAPGGGNYTYNVHPGSSLTLVPRIPTFNGNFLTGNMAGVSGSTSVTISLAGYAGVDYITVKWGNDFEAYYVAGLTGSVTLGNDINHNGISSYSYGNGRYVPDGGTTVALLGLGLAGVWCFARTRKFA
jgi:hypothetical protein